MVQLLFGVVMLMLVIAGVLSVPMVLLVLPIGVQQALDHPVMSVVVLAVGLAMTYRIVKKIRLRHLEDLEAAKRDFEYRRALMDLDDEDEYPERPRVDDHCRYFPKD